MRRFESFPRSEDPNLLLGLDAHDDAGVYLVAKDLALVQTVDFFTPIVDDPYWWGAISAANSLSDIYAMGANPVTALNLVAWPMDLDMDALARVLEGGADKAAEAGVSILGGHTIDDNEPKYGMAVTGLAHPDDIVRASTAQPGMSLVLTKPLSTGIISTAIKREAADAALIDEAVKVMSSLNREAAEAMVRAEAGAATDVTGFGLIGHLHNMAVTSGVGAELWSDRVPVLPGVEELAREGMVPGGTRRNEAYYSEFAEFDPSVSAERRLILFDAQTSGGLLIAIDESRVDQLDGAVIGRIVKAEAGRIVVK